MNKIEPIYAWGFFFVRETGLIEQVVIFEYYDPDEEYKKIVSDERLLREEKKNLARNMQYFLDSEEVLINGKRVYPRVFDVEIGFKESFNKPYVAFLIFFIGEFKPGLNIYEDKYEPEIPEYDYTVYWFFPVKARVVRAELDAPYLITGNGRVLIFNVKKNTRIKGYERIEFELY